MRKHYHVHVNIHIEANMNMHKNTNLILHVNMDMHVSTHIDMDKGMNMVMDFDFDMYINSNRNGTGKIHTWSGSFLWQLESRSVPSRTLPERVKDCCCGCVSCLWRGALLLGTTCRPGQTRPQDARGRVACS